MSRLTNIMRLVRNSGEAAERIAKKRLTIRRKGNLPMNTFGLLSDSIKFQLEVVLGMANLSLVSFEEGLKLNDGFDDIPFRGKGAGSKDSQYIQQLAVWAAKKFYGGNYKKGLKAAFAIAIKQKNERKAPKNPGWVDEIREDIDKEVNNILTRDTAQAITAQAMASLNMKI